MNTKKRGIPTANLEVMEVKSPSASVLSTKKAEAPKLSYESQKHALDLCRRKVNNYRQPEVIDRLIEECEKEALGMPKKMKKVAINTYAMLSFGRQSDEALAAFMGVSVDDQFRQVLPRFKIPEAEINQLCESRSEVHQTTVEVNFFVNSKIEESIARINNLPSSIELRDSMVAADKHKPSDPLYNATDIRVRALLYYAGLPIEEKIRVVKEIDVEYGEMLTKHTPAKYEERVQRLREMYGIKEDPAESSTDA